MRPGASSGANLASQGATRRPAGWAADLRFRQKASLLRIAGTAAFAEDLLAAGEQVAISVAYLETGALLAETLRGRRWRVCEINGEQNGGAQRSGPHCLSNRRLRRRGVHGDRSISLHRGELPGGEKPAPSSFMTCATAPFSFSKSRDVAIAMGNVR